MRILTLICFVFLLLLPGMATAQNRPNQKSADIEIAVAYYAKSPVVPNIRDLARQSPRLIGREGLSYQATLQQETQFIQRMLTEAQQGETLYTVHLPVVFRDYDEETQTFSTPDLTQDTPFFYEEFGQEFVVFFADIDSYLPFQATNAAKANRMTAFVYESMALLAEVNFAVIAADDEPFVYAGRPYNLLLGRVAEIRLWDTRENQNPIVHYEKAEWYVPENSILNLYTNP